MRAAEAELERSSQAVRDARPAEALERCGA